MKINGHTKHNGHRKADAKKPRNRKPFPSVALEFVSLGMVVISIMSPRALLNSNQPITPQRLSKCCQLSAERNDVLLKLGPVLREEVLAKAKPALLLAVLAS